MKLGKPKLIDHITQQHEIVIAQGIKPLGCYNTQFSKYLNVGSGAANVSRCVFLWMYYIVTICICLYKSLSQPSTAVLYLFHCFSHREECQYQHDKGTKDVQLIINILDVYLYFDGDKRRLMGNLHREIVWLMTIAEWHWLSSALKKLSSVCIVSCKSMHKINDHLWRVINNFCTYEILGMQYIFSCVKYFALAK